MGANRPLTGLASQTVGPAADADAADAAAAACANTCFRERAPTDGGRTGFSAGNDPPFYDLNTLKLVGSRLCCTVRGHP